MLLRNVLIVLALAGFVVTGFLYYKMYNRPPTSPLVVEPAFRPFPDSIMASGIVEAVSDNISIGTPVSGIITRVFVKVDESVKKGDPLFEVDDRDLIAELYVQKADLATAQANLRRLQDQLSRLQSVRDARAISKEEIKTKENDVTVSEAQVKQALSKVKKTLILIQRLTVKAPQDGSILKSDAHPGEFVQADAAKPVIILGNIAKLQVRVDVDEQIITRVRPGQQAIAFLKNNQRDPIPLIFDRIEPYVTPKKSFTGLNDERIDTRVLQVIYEFDNNLSFPVYVGQQVDVFINTASDQKK